VAASAAGGGLYGHAESEIGRIVGLTPPFLTLLLWLIKAWVFRGSGAAARGEVVETATFVARAVTLLWFGDRGPGRDLR
jgi:hypothetical protein